MKIYFFVFVFLLITTTLQCKIHYYDINPDSVLVVEGKKACDIKIDLNRDGEEEFIICHHSIVQFFSGFSESEALIFNPQPNRSMPTPVDEGYKINSDCAKWHNSQHTSMNMDTIWPGLSDKFIGLRFLLSNKWHYGWVKISIPANSENCVVKEYAYEDQPEVEILAGDKGASSIETAELNNNKMEVYPNPADGRISIEGADVGNMIGIYNLDGGIVREIIVPSPKFEILLDDILPGIYVIGYKDFYRSIIISR